MLVQLPIALPPLAGGILLIQVVGPYTTLGRLFDGALTDNAAGVVLAQTFVASPFLVIAARAAFEAVDPALDDVAATLGHGPLARFRRVALPSAKGGITAGLMLAWLRAFGEFGATVILAYHPYSLPVFTYVQFGITGLPGTMLPVGAALLAAFAVLGLVARVQRAWRPDPRRGRRARRVARHATAAAPRFARAEPVRLDLDLHARLGGFTLDLEHAARGRHLALMGPSGAGKSFAVRLLAGLARLDEGRVRFGADDVTGRPAEVRGVGYLPQDPALLPHLPVWRQAVFGVGADPALAAYWLDRLGLAGLEHRLPRELSGGQARRVALARALAVRPRVLLLDEPFAGLDTPVRDELRRSLRRLQRDTGLTTVLVTHDPAEAALLADEVVVLTGGRVAQAGAQREVFARPADAATARLLGVRNLLPGRLDAAGALRVAGVPVRAAAPSTAAGADGAVVWSVPPTAVRFVPEGAAGPTGAAEVTGTADGADDASGTCVLAARVVDVVHLGATSEVVLALDGMDRAPSGASPDAGPSDAALHEIIAVTGAAPPPVGRHGRVLLPIGSIMVWPALAAGSADV